MTHTPVTAFFDTLGKKGIKAREDKIRNRWLQIANALKLHKSRHRVL